MDTINFLLDYNFKNEITVIAARCKVYKKTNLNDLYEIFHDVDDGLFGYLLGRTFMGFDDVRQIIPTWAADEIRQQSTGSFTFYQHLLDATWFWRTVRSHYERISGQAVRNARVVDYGGGWGRVTRFANKDVPAGQLYVLEPNPIFRDIYAECQLPGTIVPIDWESAKPNDLDGIDLIFSYSIFTHSSDQLTRNIVNRWAEITKKGSIVAFTIRPGCYLMENDGDMAVFDAHERKTLPSKFSTEGIVYKPYEANPDWGVTIMSEDYLHKIFSGRFEIVHRAFQLQTANQMVVFIRRI